MWKVLHGCRPLSTGKILSRYDAPFLCKASLECPRNAQKIPLIASCRLASSKFSLNNQELIYCGPQAKKMLAIKGFTLFTSMFSIPVQIRLLMVNEEVLSNALYQIFLMSCVAFQTIMPLMVHFVAKRYVVRMYYNPVTDKYTAVTYRFFLMEKYTTFRASEVRLPTVEVFSVLVIKDKFPVFFDPSLFTDIEHAKRLMGFDKPIDFSTGDEKDVEDDSTKFIEPKDKEKHN